MGGWRKRRQICLLFLLVGGCTMYLGGGVQEAFAQPGSTVQLPTFSYFGVGTSVLVPDRGRTVLGNISRSSAQIRQFGVPGPIGGPWGIAAPGAGQRSFASNSSAQIAGVSVWIHDFAAMEAQLLGQRQPDVGSALSAGPGIATENFRLGQQQLVPTRKPSASGLSNTRLSSQMSIQKHTTAEQPVLSVAELRRLRQAEQEAQNQEASEWLQRGENAQQDGKLGLARIYYQMALSRSIGPLKVEVQRRLEGLSAVGSGLPSPVPSTGK